MPHKIHHIALEVADAERSADFYCRQLGFSRRARHDFPERERVIIFVSLGDVCLEFLQGPEPPSAPAAVPQGLGYKHVCLETEDVDSDVERLRAAGVKIVAEPFDTEIDSRIAFIEDPDGIIVELWQNK